MSSEKVPVITMQMEHQHLSLSWHRYLQPVVGDGITNQVSNPDVDVDVRKTNPIINQQILQLKMITEKLKKAFNGLDVDYSDISG